MGYVDTYGYQRIKAYKHSYCDKQGYVLVHRLVMEKCLGKFLPKSVIVHHKNGDRLDNRIKNLEVLTPNKHRTIHNLENNPFKGKKHREEYKKKMSMIMKKYWEKNNKQIELVCENCGKEFTRPQCRVRNKTDKYFCIYNCFRECIRK